jgi:hypothetical protein
MTNKDSFSRCCVENNIGIIPEYKVKEDKFNPN